MKDKLIKSTSTGYVAEKMKVKNTKTDIRRNEKLWSLGGIIEVSREEAIELHHEGHQVLDEESDLQNEKLKKALEPVKDEEK